MILVRLFLSDDLKRQYRQAYDFRRRMLNFLLKVIVEESVEVFYLVIKLVLAEVGFSARRGFAAAAMMAVARKRERHTDDYRTQYRNPKSHLSIVWHKDNQNQGKQNKSCSTAGLIAILLTAGSSNHLCKLRRAALRNNDIDGR